MKPQDIGINVCNNFVPLTVVPRGITGNSTVREFSEAMRRNFANKKANKGFFVPADRTMDHRQGCSIMVLSNMGPIPIRPPVADVWMQQGMESRYTDGALVLLSWEKVFGKGSEFIGKLRYSPNVWTDAEAGALGASIRFVLEDLDAGMRVDAAVKKLMEVQRSALR
jgi:hypothetical protein